MSTSVRRSNSEDVARAVRRSFVLAALVCRGNIEVGAGQPEAEDVHNRLLTWLTELDLWQYVEPAEKTLLQAPLGKLKREEMIQATWQAEGLAVLAWAWKELEFPRHDQKVDPYAVAEAVWFLNEDAGENIHTASLRSAQRRNAARELLYAIHCRLRDYLRNGERTDFIGWVEQKWLDLLGLNSSDLIAGGDLAIDGRPIGEVGTERVQEVSWITHQRHQAIIWLVERYPSYSETPVDT